MPYVLVNVTPSTPGRPDDGEEVTIEASEKGHVFMVSERGMWAVVRPDREDYAKVGYVGRIFGVPGDYPAGSSRRSPDDFTMECFLDDLDDYAPDV